MKPTVFGRVFSPKAFALGALLLLPANQQLNVISKAEARREHASKMVEIDHKARVQHAQELLGQRVAEQAGITSAEVAESLETYIYEHVIASFRANDHARARATARAILSEAARHEMDPMFVMSIVMQESRFNPGARGLHGEIGLMQIKPATAEWIAKRFKLDWIGAASLLDPETNIRLGTQYLAWLRESFRREPAAYVAAYNMGPVAVRRKLAADIMPYIYASGVMGKYRGHYRKLNLAVSESRQFNISMSMSSRAQAQSRISN